MTFLRPMIFILIAGILGYTADAHVSDWWESGYTGNAHVSDWWKSIQTLDTLTADENMIERNVEGLLMLLNRTACEVNGGPNSYDIARDSIRTYFSSCVRPVIESIVYNLNDTSSEPDIHEFMEVIANMTCPLIPNTEICFKNTMKAVKPCLASVEYDRSMSIFNVTMPLTEFICKNGGKWITDFSAANAYECMTSNAHYLSNCSSISTRRFHTFNTPMRMDDSWITSTYIDDCVELDNYADCLAETLTRCETPEPKILMKDLLDEFKVVVSCGNADEANAAVST